MKTARITTVAAWLAAVMLLAACASSNGLGRHSGRSASQQTTVSQSGDKQQKGGKKGRKSSKKKLKPAAQNPAAQQAGNDKKGYLEQVADNQQQVRFLTSKLRFSVEIGARQLTLTGNLRMKRDDVIRLQLMAFGFVEAGRLEFTKEYVLIVDRINKQYLKVPYAQLEFFRLNDINFNTLQALFWNELYKPFNAKEGGSDQLETEYGDDNDIVLSATKGSLAYRWLTDGTNARIKMANIRYSDNLRGNYQLNWDYDEFKPNERKFFPTLQKVRFTTPTKEVKMEMKLNYIGKDEDWETRTELSGKYRQMPVDDILRRFMSL